MVKWRCVISRWSVRTVLACTVPVWLMLQTIAMAQELQQDPAIDPFARDPRFHRPRGDGTTGAATRSASKPFMLMGKVQTLQQAITGEKGRVDWYTWYLACREYIASFGGIPCDLNTPITFYRDGRMEAQTTDMTCKLSLSMKRFPFPAGTELDAIVLTARARYGSPMSREELNRRVEEHR